MSSLFWYDYILEKDDCISEVGGLITDFVLSPKHGYHVSGITAANGAIKGDAKNAISVAAFKNKKRVDNNDMAIFSSWGPSNELDIKPEITAPGENIISTIDGLDGYKVIHLIKF